MTVPADDTETASVTGSYRGRRLSWWQLALGALTLGTFWLPGLAMDNAVLVGLQIAIWGALAALLLSRFGKHEVVVDERGVRVPTWRGDRWIAWSEVADVPLAGQWGDSPHLFLHNGSVVQVPLVPARLVPQLRRYAVAHGVG